MIQGPHSLGPTSGGGGGLWAKTNKPLSPSKHPVAGCPGTAASSHEAATLSCPLATQPASGQGSGGRGCIFPSSTNRK